LGNQSKQQNHQDHRIANAMGLNVSPHHMEQHNADQYDGGDSEVYAADHKYFQNCLKIDALFLSDDPGGQAPPSRTT